MSNFITLTGHYSKRKILINLNLVAAIRLQDGLTHVCFNSPYNESDYMIVDESVSQINKIIQIDKLMTNAMATLNNSKETAFWSHELIASTAKEMAEITFNAREEILNAK